MTGVSDACIGNADNIKIIIVEENIFTVLLYMKL